MFKNILWRQNNFENGKEFNVSSDLEKLTETLLSKRAKCLKIKFFYGGENEDFINRLQMQGLNKEMKDFVNFLMSDYCTRILREKNDNSH